MSVQHAGAASQCGCDCSAFPSAAVEADLRSELIEAIRAEAMIKGVTLPAATPAAIAQHPVSGGLAYRGLDPLRGRAACRV